MTTRHTSLGRRAPQAASVERQAARLRWFLVAHVLAVVLIYAVALLVGGGLASAPFPPDLPTKATRAAAARAPAPPPTAKATVTEPRAALVLPSAAPDLAAPWAQDGTVAGSPR